MANIVSNQAVIRFNNDSTASTCPVYTTVEDTLNVHKQAWTKDGGVITTDTVDGIVGKDRVVTYQVLLTNPSSTEFTTLKLADVIELNPTYTGQAFEYLEEKSDYPNASTELNTVKFIVPSLPPDTSKLVTYVVKFNDDVPASTVLTNTAHLNYDQDPTKDPTIPDYPGTGVDSEEIALSIQYSETTVTAEKEAPDTVLCGSPYTYTLTFTNTGDQTATDVSIVDTLPAGFTTSQDNITITNGQTVLTTSDYSYDLTGNVLTLSEIPQAITPRLNILSGEALVVKITGTSTC